MNNRLHHLDGLRGVAALLVVIHHGVIAFDFALYSGLAEHSRFSLDTLLSGLPFTTAALGDLAVCVFFVLSGYVLARSFSRTPLGVGALVAKRYVRLGLPILAVVLLAWALLAAGAMQNVAVARLTRSAWLASQALPPPDAWDALKDGLYGALLLGHSHYVSSLWTMPIEFQGSMILIMVFMSCRRLLREGPQRDTWCGAALLVFAAAMHGSFLFLFGVGAAACLFDLRRRAEPVCRYPGVVFALVCFGLLLGTMPFSAARPELINRFVELAPINLALPWRRMEPESFWHAVGAVLLLVAVDANPALRAWFSKPSRRFLGEISFPLYLVHVPILLSFGCGAYLWLSNARVPVLAATILAVLASCAASLVAATVLTWTVERAAIDSSIVAGNRVQAWAERRKTRLSDAKTVA